MPDNDIRIINTEDEAAGDPNLEPAGYKRDEQLAQRTDKLAQAAEEIGEEREVHAFDPSKLKPDWDILQHINELQVDDGVPGYRYMWVYEGLNGQMIVKKSRLGWVVVQSEMPECEALRDARGYRKIGDTILMRIPQERFDQLEAADEYRRLMQQKGIKSALREMGEKYRSKGFIVHEDVDDVKVGGSRGSKLGDVMEQKARQAGATSTAMAGVDNMIRKGDVPGLPGRGR